MLFSVVIPTYNREKIIGRAVNSILLQTYSNYEIIVIDDGSSDNTESILKAIKFNLKYFKTENFGVAHARNFGIKQACGEYVCFLDSDDMIEPNHLQNAYNFIVSEKYPEVAHLNFLWGKGDKIIKHKNILPKKLPYDLFKNCSLHVNCIFIKNEIVKNNLFNESRALMFAEDWDFFIKLAVRFPIHLLDKTSAFLVDHDDRNMRNFDEQKWVIKRDAIIFSLNQDAIIKKSYLKELNLVSAHMNSLIAVNFAVRKNKLKCIKFWFLSLAQNYRELYTKRSLAIIKHLIISW